MIEDSMSIKYSEISTIIRLICGREVTEQDWEIAANLGYDPARIRIRFLLDPENQGKWPLLNTFLGRFARKFPKTKSARILRLEKLGITERNPSAYMATINYKLPPAEPLPQLKSDLCLALIASRNYLPFADVALTSFRRHHPDVPAFLLLVDGSDSDRQLLGNTTIMLLDDLGLGYAGWLTSKYSATELANALKPAFLRRLAPYADRAIYLDTDIAVFAPMTALIEATLKHALVAVPHTYAPFPNPEHFWVHPNNADIFNAGLFNAGIFGISLTSTQNFLEFWLNANLAVGAFHKPVGAQTDQQYFNWAITLVDGLFVLRDTAYNVAYWNLHDRSLRYEDINRSWEVDGAPLVCFHFSGFNVHDRLLLSKHDNRYSIYNLPSVTRILAWFADAVLSSSLSRLLSAPYRYDMLANGFRITPHIREILKNYEKYLPRYDGRCIEGADQICQLLMTPLPAVGSTLPLIAADIYDRRPDLHEVYPNVHTNAFPEGFWHWFCRHGTLDFHVEFLVARFRRALASDSLIGFSEEVERTLGAESANLQFLGSDRTTAAALLRGAGRPELAESLLGTHTELFFFTDIGAIITCYERRPDLIASFPKIFSDSHEQFTDWLEKYAYLENGAPETAVDVFRSKTAESVCARIYNFICRRDDLTELASKTLLTDDPVDLFRELIRGSGEGLEYDLADLEVFRYLHTHEREWLVILYLELPQIRSRRPSPRVPGNGEESLPPGIRGKIWAHLGCQRHTAYFDPAESLVEDEMRGLWERGLAPARHVLDVLKYAKARTSAVTVAERAIELAARRLEGNELLLSKFTDDRQSALAGGAPAINVFGYFCADTGVGESSRGLSAALALLRDVRKVPMGTGSLKQGTRLGDLFVRYQYWSDTNVIVSYPHQHEDFFGILPREFMQGRRNIIHLAWEQRDWNPHWQSVYDRYDEIWAISEFAAMPFKMMFPNRVRVVPNVLDFDTYPACIEEVSSRFSRPRFRFLFVFDANSSIERKNPEGLLDAFIAAFSGTNLADAVELYFKVSSLHRPEHSSRVGRLADRAVRSGLAVKFDGRQLPRDEIMRLIASADCYVSLHRAEGFGYTMAEAMYYGVPVIASAYSGNLEYMTHDNSFLVPCTEALVKEADGPFQRGSIWGEPDLDAAAAMMKLVVENQENSRTIGDQGRATVVATLSANAIAKGLSAAIPSLHSNHTKLANT